MEKLKTTKIKGKSYVEVNERIRAFRTIEKFKNYSLVSDIVSLEEGVCVIKATIYNESDRPIATGIAYEKEGSTFINKTSYIENCETSAWGRALGNLGIGIDTSIATYEEVSNAISNQKNKSELVDLTPLKARMDKAGKKVPLDKYLSGFKEEGINLTKDDERILKTYYNTNMGD